MTSVEPLEGLRLRVAFNDGVRGIVDVEPLLWGEMFAALRDPVRFGEVFLDADMGTVAWPNDADLAPAALHERYLPEPSDIVAAR